MTFAANCYHRVSQYMQSLFGEPDKEADKKKEGKNTKLQRCALHRTYGE